MRRHGHGHLNWCRRRLPRRGDDVRPGLRRGPQVLGRTFPALPLRARDGACAPVARRLHVRAQIRCRLPRLGPALLEAVRQACCPRTARVHVCVHDCPGFTPTCTFMRLHLDAPAPALACTCTCVLPRARCAEFAEAYNRLTLQAAAEAQSQLDAYNRGLQRMREIEEASNAAAYEAQRHREARGVACRVCCCCLAAPRAVAASGALVVGHACLAA